MRRNLLQSASASAKSTATAVSTGEDSAPTKAAADSKAGELFDGLDRFFCLDFICQFECVPTLNSSTDDLPAAVKRGNF
eukprot:245201-Chlamydomonas_euryale.AAC.6